MISTAQLRTATVSPAGVDRWVAAGRLHRVHRGVYAVGHPNLSQEGTWLAAVLACGDGAVLSHCSAAALWKIRPSRASMPPGSAAIRIDVTVPRNGGRAKRRGINVHRSTTLQPGECTLRRAIPVTKPARTLDDLRRVLSRREFAAALREAQFLRLPIGDRFGMDQTRSELERRLLALCRRHRLPMPKVNARVGPRIVDFSWPAKRLIVEVDGWAAHRTRSAFEEDRSRDAGLKVLGYEVLRFTWRQVDSQPGRVAKTIRALLRR